MIEFLHWPEEVEKLALMLVAYLLAVPIALDRERHARSAGLRTFPLTAMACCALVLIGRSIFEGEQPRARIIYGVLTGMGFIGGSAILKTHLSVAGAATAATIWATAAIGIACAYEQFALAIGVSIATVTTLLLGGPIKHTVGKASDAFILPEEREEAHKAQSRPPLAKRPHDMDD